MNVIEIIQRLGEPEKTREVYGGELELLYQNTIFRFIDTRFVECTLPDPGPVIIDQIPVLNLFEWLSGLYDIVDRARFRVSVNTRIAYDYTDPSSGSVILFQPGHWDGQL
ncbi:MAG: hypothetical protein ACI8RT_001477 [Candidatus Azotimanducaceae bacterium]|jgi:hypothetical protein|tara:strand:+ start:384 stop:713 length:330 start_codon:yes stop_codon:yes gene_type:complete